MYMYMSYKLYSYKECVTHNLKIATEQAVLFIVNSR
jgi:hypothetical protein